MANNTPLTRPLGNNNQSLADAFFNKMAEFGVDEASQRLGVNSTWRSGALKIIGAFGLDYASKKMGVKKYVSHLNSGLLQDGVTDAYVDLRQMFNKSMSGRNQDTLNVRVV